MLTNRQISCLLFRDGAGPGGVARASDAAADQACNRYCLRRLFDRGLLRRREVILRSPVTHNHYQAMVNLPTKEGFEMVQDVREDAGQARGRWSAAAYDLSNFTVAHILAIHDFLIHLQRACARRELAVVAWYLDRDLAAMKGLGFGAIPDALIVVQRRDGKRVPLFVEIDRGTETVIGVAEGRRDWFRKIGLYGDYLATQGGAFYRLDFYTGLERPLVLTVTTTHKRIDTMITATRKAEGEGTYWYTTAAELYADEEPDNCFAPLWRTAVNDKRRSLAERF